MCDLPPFWGLIFDLLSSVLLFCAASEMVALRELDLRAAKKQVCKITPELVAALKERFCKVRGGVIKKAKGGGKKKAPK